MAFFSLFSSLPVELRLHVWRCSFQPRAVEVRYLPEMDECRTITKPPAILEVCRESREEALRFYRKVFGTKTHAAAIYFHPTIDVLYVPRHRPMGYDETTRDFPSHILDTAEHIHTLAIDHVLPDIKRPWETYNKLCLMMSLPNLREAFMIISTESDDGRPGAGAEIELIDPKEDKAAITQLMDGIEQTYSHEIGEICWEEEAEEGVDQEGVYQEGQGHSPTPDKDHQLYQHQEHQYHHLHHPSFPPIVPKKKISHVWETHGAMVSCV